MYVALKGKMELPGSLAQREKQLILFTSARLFSSPRLQSFSRERTSPVKEVAGLYTYMSIFRFTTAHSAQLIFKSVDQQLSFFLPYHKIFLFKEKEISMDPMLLKYFTLRSIKHTEGSKWYSD